MIQDIYNATYGYIDGIITGSSYPYLLLNWDGAFSDKRSEVLIRYIGFSADDTDNTLTLPEFSIVETHSMSITFRSNSNSADKQEQLVSFVDEVKNGLHHSLFDGISEVHKVFATSGEYDLDNVNSEKGLATFRLTFDIQIIRNHLTN